MKSQTIFEHIDILPIKSWHRSKFRNMWKSRFFFQNTYIFLSYTLFFFFPDYFFKITSDFLILKYVNTTKIFELSQQLNSFFF